MAGAEFILLGGDRVPTLKKVVGERTWISLSTDDTYPSSTMTATYNYRCDPGNPAQAAGDIEKLSQYLAEQEGYTKKNAPAGNEEGNQREQVWSKASVDTEKEIIVSIATYAESYTVSITKMAVQGSSANG